jgi:hypothetical protein
LPPQSSVAGQWDATALHIAGVSTISLAGKRTQSEKVQAVKAKAVAQLGCQEETFGRKITKAVTFSRRHLSVSNLCGYWLRSHGSRCSYSRTLDSSHVGYRLRRKCRGRLHADKVKHMQASAHIHAACLGQLGLLGNAILQFM